MILKLICHFSQQLSMAEIWYLVTSFISIPHIVGGVFGPIGFYTHWTYMLISRRIFLIKYWWQKPDISSQTIYRNLILWEAFLDPFDSRLPTWLVCIHIEHICGGIISEHYFILSDNATLEDSQQSTFTQTTSNVSQQSCSDWELENETEKKQIWWCNGNFE